MCYIWHSMILSCVTFQGPVAIKVAKKAIDNGMQVCIVLDPK